MFFICLFFSTLFVYHQFALKRFHIYSKCNLWSLIFPGMWATKLGSQLGRPTRSVGGWLLSKMFKTRNKVLEERAVQLCGVQPGDTVLELGHGPGLGLELAAKLLTAPTGHMIGVDYSDYMHQVRCFHTVT